MWSIFQAIKRSWTQHFVAQFSAFIIMSMTYGAVLFISIGLVNIKSLFDTWGEISKVSIYLKKSDKKKSSSEIEQFLTNHGIVRDFKKVSSQASAQNFQKKFAKLSSQKFDSKKIKEFFPEYYLVSLNQSLAYKEGAPQLESFAAELREAFTNIKSISYGKKWLNRYVGLLTLIQNTAWVLIFLFTIATVVVSSSVVKTILFSRRDEIEILEFVGADDSSIYLPQIVNIALLGIGSFLTALVFQYAVVENLRNSSIQIESQKIFSQLQFLSVPFVLFILSVSLFSIILYSSFTVFQLLPRRNKALMIEESHL